MCNLLYGIPSYPHVFGYKNYYDFIRHQSIFFDFSNTFLAHDFFIFHLLLDLMTDETEASAIIEF